MSRTPKYKRGDLVYFYNNIKGEVAEDTIRSHKPLIVDEDTFYYMLFKNSGYYRESFLFKSVMECLQDCYAKAQEQMIGAELDLKHAQVNVDFFHNLILKEQRKVQDEQET